MTQGQAILRLRGVGLVLNRSTILRDVNADLLEREVVGVVGANGSGKTTLLRIIATLLPATAGSVEVLNHDRTGFRRIRDQIELIGHTPALYPELTLRENLAFVTKLAGRASALVDRHLITVGLSAAADRRADRSSHGMQRRIEFARALIREPQLLLLDEAHAGLDADARGLVDHVIEDVRARNGAVVMVSHEADRMTGSATRIVQLAGGTIMAGEAG